MQPRPRDGVRWDMRVFYWLILLGASFVSTELWAQRQGSPVVDVAVPDLRVANEAGELVELRELVEGKYFVLATACLTCPKFLNGYPELEAAYVDYGKQGVGFGYLYKSLRHPELSGLVQPQNLKERLLHVEAAKQKLGTSIPWFADTMEDEARAALVANSNSVYLMSPEGRVVKSWGTIDGEGFRESFRAALAEHVGVVEQPTSGASLDLPRVERSRPSNEDSEVTVERPMGMQILVTEAKEPEVTHYAKLRAEGDSDLVRGGTGRMFLGFYPDPILGAHWNNLAPPLQYRVKARAGVTLTPGEGKAAKGPGDEDVLPRQFWVDVAGATAGDEMEVTMVYYACTEDMCLQKEHTYVLKIEPENRGSATYGFNPRGQGKGKGKGKGKGGKGER